MKILFVASGNNNQKVNSLIKAQGDSLENIGAEVEYFLIKGKGINGYLKHIPILRDYLSRNKFDIVHAHYSYCGFVTALAGAKPLVTSLMGSDINSSRLQKLLIYPFNFIFWDKVIVKSVAMQEEVKIKNTEIIPNGVNLEKFAPMDKTQAIRTLNWDEEKVNILFAANPDRPEKNYELAFNSIQKFNKDYSVSSNIYYLKGVKHEQVPIYMNAADVVILTSLWEGSPNVIKEAMACNKPIVSTKVGDVEHIFLDVEGVYLTHDNVLDISKSLFHAYDFSIKYDSTQGRSKIIKLGLDSKLIAKRLIDLYNDLIN